MPEPCPVCQKPIPEGALSGLCPACLVGSAARWWAEEGGAKAHEEVKDVPPADEAGQRIGTYKLLQQIGEGGFGTVWMAEQEEPVRRRVALKIIKLGMDTREVVARFEQERQALAMMDHPNIAKVFDAGSTVQGRPFFVMELVRGIRITEYCDRNNVPTSERLRLFISVCQAVQHAHQKGVIHRDLKPSNILVTLHDGTPVPKVIDFGVAKATQMRLTEKTLFTQFERMIGTPLYMSPEQAEMSGLDVDTRSDIYSLGVLLYELLVGRPPFEADGLMKRGIEEIRRVIREQEPPKPSTVLHTMAQEALTDVAHRRASEPPKLIRAIRGDLDWIVMKALEKDRTRRYETANGFGMDVQRYLNSEPVLARAPSSIYRFRKLVARNRVAFAGGAAVVAALVLGFSVSTVLFFKTRAAEREQAQLRQRAESALAELRGTAPTFHAQAATLVEEGKFDAALEKIGYAVKLAEEESRYRLFRGNLLQAMQRLPEAAEEYRRVLALSPAESGAQKNLALCERLLAQNGGAAALTRDQQITLVDALIDQGRAVEAGPLAAFLGRGQETAETVIRARLKPLQSQSGWSDGRLHRLSNGTFQLYLSDLTLPDLSILRDLPISRLNLDRSRIGDLRTLPPLPLRELRLSTTKTADISPLRGLPLEVLDVSDNPVADLSPLAGMRLRSLNITVTHVVDLRPLQGMPLETLNLEYCHLTELSAIRGAPLTKMRASNSKLADLSALAGAPLAELVLSDTPVSDLRPLAGSPIQLLDVKNCDGIVDFSPLLECPNLETLIVPRLVHDPDTLRRMTWLKRISDRSLPLLAGKESLPTYEEFFATNGERLFRNAENQKQLKKLHAELRNLGADNGVIAKVKLDADGFFDIDLGSFKVKDLSFLAGLPVRALSVIAPVTDLSPLAGAPLRRLSIIGGKFTDLSPLRGAPLEFLNLPFSPIQDITPLAECRELRDLRLANTPVSDVSSLTGLHLLELHLLDTPVEDASPLAEIGTLENLIAPRKARGIAALRQLPNLKRISFDWDGRIPQSSQEFWSKFEPEKER